MTGSGGSSSHPPTPAPGSVPSTSHDLPTRVEPPDPPPATDATQAAPPPGTGPMPLTAATLAQGGLQRTGITQLHIRAGDGDPAGTHRGEQWGDFLLGDLIGRGGMGAVYHGTQISLDRRVAVKALPPHLSADANFRERFHKEAKAVAKLSSPHVIQVYGAGVHEGHHYFAMEYVEGRDLAQRLRDGLRPSHQVALDLVTQAARGLAAAGELGIVHRDIKPANMMVTPKGQLKLMDFGLVKLASEEHSLTMSGTVMGTVSYFSPEQGRGEPCDQRTDLYALGVVFYELLTGRLPFTGTDATSIIYQHVHTPPKPPREIDPHIPEAYQAVVLKCLQKRADDRYATAHELLEDLERLAQGQPPVRALADPASLRSGGTVVRSTAFRQERRRSIRILVGAGVVVAVVVGGTAWWRTHTPATDQGERQASAVPVASLDKPAVPAVPARTDPAPGAAPPASSTPPAAPPPAVAATATTVPAPPAAPAAPLSSPGGAVDVHTPAEVFDLVRAGRLAQARRIVDERAALVASDPDWQACARALDRAQGAELLLAVRLQLEQGDLAGARTSITAARRLVPDAPELAQLTARLEALAAAEQARAQAIAEAERQLTPEAWPTALATLQRLDAERPGDAAIAKDLERAHALEAAAAERTAAVGAAVTAGDAALARQDYDQAAAAYANAQALDAANAAAAAGLTKVTRAREAVTACMGTLQAALAKGDLEQAADALERLHGLLPPGPALTEASERVARARQRQQEAEQARLSASTQDLLARIDDPHVETTTLAKDVAALVQQWPGDSPERQLLEGRLATRLTSDAVAALLPRFDAAVLAGDAAAIARLVDDAGFAAALAALHRYAGLVFTSRLTSLQAQGDVVVAEIAIRHALAVYPLRQLHYRLHLRHDAQGAWHITDAHLEP